MQNNYTINDFEGPLDLLLHLVRSSKVDISEIDTRSIIDQYLMYIKEMESLNIDVASIYLVMASELIHLKSRMLINKSADDEEDTESEFNISSEDDLKRKLIEYEKYKNITSLFRDMEFKRSEIYTKEPENLDEYKEDINYEFGEVSIDLLVKAFNDLQKKIIISKPINTKIYNKEISIKDRIVKIKDILKTNKRVEFMSLFEELTREYVIVTFLAILEMSKNNEIVLNQENNFEPIIIERNETDE